jgi:hypothetical protein
MSVGLSWRHTVASLAAVAVLAAVAAPLVRRAIDKPDTAGVDSALAVNTTAAIRVTPSVLEDFVRSSGIPIFWIGPQSGYTYEYTRTSPTRVYLRYLPPGVSIGSNAEYLTIGTYRVTGAYATIRAILKKKNSVSVPVDGGLAVYTKTAPDHVYISYPRLDYQVEVFDPKRGAAAALVASGSVVPVKVPSR